MGNTQLSTSFLNQRYEPFFYRMNEAEGKGIQDLVHFYAPHGPMRKVVTYLGPSGGVPIHVGHSENFDFDYMMRRMMGLSSLNTSIGETLFAGGKGADIPNMFVSTLGEAVERFLGSLAIYEKAEEIEYGTIKQMASRGYNCLGPEDLPLFAEEQFKAGDLYYQRFTEDSFLGWIEGKRLLSGDAVWLPVQIVALFYSLHPEEDLVGYSTSGGLASHISKEEALFHGITELIERDAVNLRWVSRMPPEPIELDRPIRSRGLQKLLEMSRGVPGGSTFYLQTTDIPEIPVVTVMEVCRWLKKWSYYAGGGVNLDIDQAMLQALTEFGQSERSLRLAQSAPDWGFSWGVRSMFDVDEDTPVSQIDIFFKIIAYYGYPKNVRKMDHYMNDGKMLGLSSLATDDSKTTEDRFLNLCKVLRHHKIDPIVFDFTPPQLKNIRLMKTYIPELALPYLHSKPLLGHPRFYEMPRKLGYTSKPLEYKDLLTDPMPYP